MGCCSLSATGAEEGGQGDSGLSGGRGGRGGWRHSAQQGRGMGRQGKPGLSRAQAGRPVLCGVVLPSDRGADAPGGQALPAVSRPDTSHALLRLQSWLQS